jgi:hypothetical protein
MPGTILPGIIEMALRIDLQAAKDGDVDMAAADQPERHRAVERAGTRQRADRAAAGVRQRRMRQALLGDRPGADQSVLGLKEHFQVRRNVVCDQRRDADAEIDEVAALQLLGHPPGDDDLRIHGLTRS